MLQAPRSTLVTRARCFTYIVSARLHGSTSRDSSTLGSSPAPGRLSGSKWRGVPVTNFVGTSATASLR